jgi:predicted negative regulator of RcsB-dependent stress response
MNPEIYKIEGLIYEAINDRVNAIIAWKNCLKFSNDKKLKEECKIHLNNLSIE